VDKPFWARFLSEVRSSFTNMSSRSDDRAAGRGDPDPVPADSVPVDPASADPVPDQPVPTDPGPTGLTGPAGAGDCAGDCAGDAGDDGDGAGLVAGEYWVDSTTGEVESRRV
jgi:hypothetical protein